MLVDNFLSYLTTQAKRIQAWLGRLKTYLSPVLTDPNRSYAIMIITFYLYRFVDSIDIRARKATIALTEKQLARMYEKIRKGHSPE